ncbi:FitA-like ribbon-helix-helix domain-containing protein [Microbacterium sp.]|uniref:FitA-like ribbon-helix-helix domain-containing protein n=1 Tax=Microbacterium sp. TaxID=51671 RepID=UPI003A9303DC
MSTLQVRNLPDDLHARLAERSSRLGVSMSEYVTRVLRADLDRPLFADWVAAARGTGSARDIDVRRALDAARDEYDSRGDAA